MTQDEILQSQKPITFERLLPATFRAFKALDSQDPELKKRAKLAIGQTAYILDIAATNPDPRVSSTAERLLREITYEGARRSGLIDRAEKRRQELASKLNRIRTRAGRERGRPEDFPGYSQMSGELQYLEQQSRVLSHGLEGFWRDSLGGGFYVDGVTTEKPFLGPVGAALWEVPIPFVGKLNPSDKYRLDEDVARVPLIAPTPAAQRRYEIMRAPEEDIFERDGKKYLRTQTFGDWELPDMEPFKEQLRQSFTGTKPGSLGFISSEALTTNIPIWVHDKLFSDDWRGSVVDVPTADPTLALPFLPDGLTAEDLQNPLTTRAIMHTVREMQQNGELHPSWYEVTNRMLVGMAEFVALNSAVGAGAGMAARGAAASSFTPLRVAGATALRGASALGLISKRPYWHAVTFGMRNMGEEVVYAVAQSFFSGGTAAEGAGQGIFEGAFEWAAASLIAAPARKGLYRMAERLHLPGNQALKRFAQARGKVPTFDSAWNSLRSLPSKSVEFRSFVRQGFKDAARAEAFVRTWDAVWVGSIFGAFQHVSSQYSREEWSALSTGDKALAIAQAFTSPEALGNNLAMGVTALAHGALQEMGAGPFREMSEEEDALVELISRSLAHRLSHPEPEVYEEFVTWFEQAKAANPELFPHDRPFRLETEDERLDRFIAERTEGAQPALPTEDDSPPLETALPKARSRERREEILTYFEPAVASDSGRLDAFTGDPAPTAIVGDEGISFEGGEPGLWIHQKGRYGVRREENGSYVIVRADNGQKVKARGVKPWATLEDAMAQVNRIEGVRYTTEAAPGQQTLDYPEVEQVSGGPFRLTWEWQQVPRGTSLPPGIDVRTDENGVTWAKLPGEPRGRRLPMWPEEPGFREPSAPSPAQRAARETLEEVGQGAPEPELPDVDAPGPSAPSRRERQRRLAERRMQARRRAQEALQEPQETEIQFGDQPVLEDTALPEAEPEAAPEGPAAEQTKPKRKRRKRKSARKARQEREERVRSAEEILAEQKAKRAEARREARRRRAQRAAGRKGKRKGKRTPLERARSGELGLVRWIQGHGGLPWHPEIVEVAERLGLPTKGPWRFVQAKPKEPQDVAGQVVFGGEGGRGDAERINKADALVEQWAESAVDMGFIPPDKYGSGTPRANDFWAAVEADLSGYTGERTAEKLQMEAEDDRFRAAKDQLQALSDEEIRDIALENDIDPELPRKKLEEQILALPSVSNPETLAESAMRLTADEQEFIADVWETDPIGLGKPRAQVLEEAIEDTGVGEDPVEIAREHAEATMPPDPAGLTGASAGYAIDQQGDLGGIPSETKLRQAAAEAARAVRFLINNGFLEPDADAMDTSVQSLLWRLALGDPDLRGNASEKDWVRAVQWARNYQSHIQGLALHYARQEGELSERALKSYYRALQDLAERGELTDPIREELRATGQIDETGKLHPSVVKSWQKWFGEQVAKDYDSFDADTILLLYALNPVEAIIAPIRALNDKLGLFVDPYAYELVNGAWQPIESNLSISGIASIGRNLDRLEKTLGKIGSGTLAKALRRMRRWAQENIGQTWDGSYLRSRTAGGRSLRSIIYEGVQEVFSPREAEEFEVRILLEHILNGLRWDGSLAPGHIRRAFLKMIAKGAFKKMRGPEDVERLYGKGTGYLFPLMERLVSLTDRLGTDLKNLGVLTEEQMKANRGQWVPKIRIRANQEDDYHRLQAGDYSVVIAGHDMLSVATNENELSIRVWEPDYVLPKGVGREARARHVFGVLTDLMNRGLAVSQETIAGWKPHERFDWELVAARPERGDIHARKSRDPINGRSLKGRQLANYEFLQWLDEGSQSRESWEKGELPKKGQRPFTEAKERLLDFYLGKRDPRTGERIPNTGAALPFSLAVELDIMLNGMMEMRQPSTSLLEAVRARGTEGFSPIKHMVGRLNDLHRWWRRNLTILNYAHWTRSMFSDIETNHMLGVAGRMDFIRFALKGEGPYALAAQHALDWEEAGTYVHWARHDAREAAEKASHATSAKDRKTLLESIPLPQELKEKGWTQERWANVLQFNEFARIITGGTFVESILTDNMTSAIIGRMARRDEVTEQLLDQIENEGGLDGNAVKLLTDAVTEIGRRAAPGYGEIEAKILKAFGEHDPNERMKGIQDWIGLYQLKELWMAYSGVLNILSNNEGMTLRDAAAAAKRGTADYRQSNRKIMAITNQFGALGQGARSKYEKYLPLKQLGAFMLARPFMGYDLTMMKGLARTVAAHPVRALSSSIVLSLLSAAMYQLARDDDEEYPGQGEDQLWNLLAGTVGHEGSPTPRELRADAERFAQLFPDGWLPNGMGGGYDEGHEGGNAAYQLFLRWMRLAPHIVPVGERRGSIQVSNIADLAPGVGQGLKAAYAAKNLSSPYMTAGERARRTLEALEGFWPSAATAFASGALGVFAPAAGRGKLDVGLKEAQRLLERTMPAAHPMFAPASRQGIRALENGVLGGQDVSAWLRGIDPVWKDAPDDLVADTLWNIFWSSSSAIPYRRIDRGDEVARQLLQEVLPSVPNRGTEWTAAALFVSEQMKEIVRGSYMEWKHWGKQGSDQFGENFDSMLAPHLALSLDLDQEALSRGEYVLGAEPQSTLGKAIAGQDKTMQPKMIRFALNFLAGPAFGTRARSIMMQAARNRQMTPDLFVEYYRRSLQDPNGRGIIKEMHRLLVEKGVEDELEQHYDLFWQLDPPNPDTSPEAYLDWHQLREFFFDRLGYNLQRLPNAPPEPPSRFLGPGGRFLGYQAVKRELLNGDQ